VDAIAEQFGVTKRTIYRYLDDGVSRTTGSIWTPLCMDADEFETWSTTAKGWKTPNGRWEMRPCTDCPLSFAAEMRAEGKCNGTPGWRPPADDYEEADVGDTITVGKVTISAPCGSCAHREVCAIRRTLGSLEEADVTIPKPDPALTIALGINVECSHYLRAKNTGTGGAKRVLSEAGLKALRDGAARGRATHEANAAARRAAAAEATA